MTMPQGDDLKAIRLRAGKSQINIADHLIVSKQAVSSWERGYSKPSARCLKRLAKFLGVSVDAIWDACLVAEQARKAREGNHDGNAA
jgi:transcriptional regulator with XRE-family HTH domain